MRLQPPDQLSTLLIWIAAVFMATKEGIDKMTAPGKVPIVDLGGVWSFLPLALLLLAAVVSIFRSTNGGVPTAAATPSASAPSEPWLTPFLRNFIVIMLIMLVFDLGQRLLNTYLPPHGH